MQTVRPRDRGQAVLLMVAVVACCGLLALAVGTLGGAVRDRQQAQTAADAAALAGVDGGEQRAAEIAAANGGVLTNFERIATAGGGWTVTAGVSVEGVRASARATNGP
jgi:Flp pilus assembly protein TadG